MPEKLLITADEDRIEQVLANLISNAIRYSPEGGAIDVEARIEGDVVHIPIRDQGLGISKEHQQIIFVRLGRAHGTGFCGLGLAIRQADRRAPWRQDLGGIQRKAWRRERFSRAAAAGDAKVKPMCQAIERRDSALFHHCGN